MNLITSDLGANLIPHRINCIKYRGKCKMGKLRFFYHKGKEYVLASPRCVEWEHKRFQIVSDWWFQQTGDDLVELDRVCMPPWSRILKSDFEKTHKPVYETLQLKFYSYSDVHEWIASIPDAYCFHCGAKNTAGLYIDTVDFARSSLIHPNLICKWCCKFCLEEVHSMEIEQWKKLIKEDEEIQNLIKLHRKTKTALRKNDLEALRLLQMEFKRLEISLD